MNEEWIAQIDSRLASIERSIGILVDRAGATEVKTSQTTKWEPQTSRPEPVARPMAPPIQTVPQIPTAPAFEYPKSASTPELSEYQLGAQWLPRIGAGLVVLGIAFLIGLGVSKGWITPPMLFAGALVLCFSFIGLGFRLKDAHEDFGQILSGIGSCGIFMTFAGGHVYQDLYSGETMVAGFMVWSFVNLAYAMWQSSKSFLTIGVMGGFMAAVMPLSKDGYALSLALHSAILVTSALIMVRHRIDRAPIYLWLASTAGLLPLMIQQDFSWIARTGAIYGSSMICIVAYLASRKEHRQADDQSFMVVAMTMATTIAISVQWNSFGTWHTLLAALACSLLAYGYRREESIQKTFSGIAIVLATIVAPFGFQPHIALFVQVGLTIASVAISVSIKRIEIQSLAFILGACASISYLLHWGPGNSPAGLEPAMMWSLLACSVSLALGLGKREDDPRLAVVWLGAWLLTSKLASMYIAMPEDFKMVSFGLTISWVLYGIALLIVGFAFNLKNYRYAALTVLLFSVGKVLVIDMSTSTPEIRVAVLMAVGLSLLAGGYAYIRRRHILKLK